MKFSRNAENEADRVGAQMMARAGYDPMAMASFFDLLQQQRGRNSNAVAQFFSSHPSPANRSANIRRLAQSMDARPHGAAHVRPERGAGEARPLPWRTRAAARWGNA